jgi:hypothetical protein
MWLCGGLLCLRFRGLLRVLPRLLRPAEGQHEAATEEIEERPAKHLALEHFQTVDLPLDRAATPGERHTSFDRRILLVQPQGKASQGLQRAGGRPLQRGIQGRRLSLVDQCTMQENNVLSLQKAKRSAPLLAPRGRGTRGHLIANITPGGVRG